MIQQKKLIFLSFGLFLLTLSFYAGLIIYFDNTNLTTTNGLYKSIDVWGWEKGTRFVVDSGGLLYAFTMGMIAKLIPDQWMTFYGTVTDFITYRKLAWIHAGFGAGATTVVFLLAYQVTRDWVWAILVSIIHTTSAFILVNSIISEDIMPGYFFFVLGFLLFYQSITTAYTRLYLTGTTFCVLAALFLHWTLFPPMVCVYGLLTLELIRKRNLSFRLITEQLVLFNGLIFLFVTVANFLFGSHFQSKLEFFQVLYPKKAGPGSWVGLSWHKFESLYLGVGNFLVGCQNIPTLSQMSYGNFLQTVVSWIVALLCLGIVIRFIRPQATLEQRLVAGFGLGIFIFGQMQNMYGQPQDPQFQVQPMFLITSGLILLFFYQKYRAVLKMGLAVAILLIRADNILTLKSLRGGDSQSVMGYEEFRDAFSKKDTKIVHLAYENWSSWLMVFEYGGDFKVYLQDITCLNTPFHFQPDITIHQAAQEIINDIEKALNKGKRVIATTPWVNPNDIELLQSQNLAKPDIEKLKTILLSRYRVKKIHTLKWDTFAELERNPEFHE